MSFKNFLFICSAFFLFVNFACSSDSVKPVEPVERPEVNITTPIDADGVLNKVEADAVMVKGTSTLGDGYIISVRISDAQNHVSGTAVMQGGKWSTESLSISGFNNGKIFVTADGTNEIGTLSNTAETSLYLDQQPPTISISGPIAEDDIIDSDEATEVVVRGTSDAANDQMVLITFGDDTAKHLITEAMVNNGMWETEVDVSSLKSGSLLLMAEVSDLAGNPATAQRAGVVLE